MTNTPLVGASGCLPILELQYTQSPSNGLRIPCTCMCLNHLAQECPQQSATTRDSIVRWLLAKDLKRLQLLQPKELEVAKQAMEYRWKILHQRYLGISPEGAYRNLITRLGSLVSAHSQIQTWVASSRARQSSFIDVLQHLIKLDLRHLKTTLGMDVLRCKTPSMVRKEIYVYLLAYNLLRSLMWSAGTTYWSLD
ncbi:hypothetical protein H6G98_06805 [Nostoc sp. FACHB-857]|nr:MULTISPECIES: hypothetical protein [Nostoc]MBD2677406.1 hypothetical protein [Nostoc sp. FACHB-857]